jgi:hypothetical protein
MTIWGWDVSHFDAPDTRQAVAEGFSFFTHKAGGDANDAELNAWWVMKPYRDQVLLGAYWVLYPDKPVARADSFLARLDAQCPGWQTDRSSCKRIARSGTTPFSPCRARWRSNSSVTGWWSGCRS